MPTGGSNQIVDTATGNSGSIAASGSGSIALAGTLWPLLATQTYKFYNFGLNVVGDVDDQVEIRSLSIVVQLLDGLHNIISNVIVAAENYTKPTLLTSHVGESIASDGIPLLELFSNLNFTGFTTPGAGTTAGFFQVTYTGDFHNADAGATHVVTGTGISLWSLF